jgi:hypothetical protein
VPGHCRPPCRKLRFDKLLDDIAPAGSLARAYTVLVAVGLLGIAAGSAAGGTLGAAFGVRTGLAACGGVFGLATLWTVIRIRTIPITVVTAAPETHATLADVS